MQLSTVKHQGTWTKASSAVLATSSTAWETSSRRPARLTRWLPFRRRKLLRRPKQRGANAKRNSPPSMCLASHTPHHNTQEHITKHSQHPNMSCTLNTHTHCGSDLTRREKQYLNLNTWKKHEKTISKISSAIVPVRCRAPYGWTWACSCFPSKTCGSLRICCVQQPGRLCNPNSMKAVALWLGEAKRLHDGHASWRNPLTGNVILVFFLLGRGHALTYPCLPWTNRSIGWQGSKGWKAFHTSPNPCPTSRYESHWKSALAPWNPHVKLIEERVCAMLLLPQFETGFLWRNWKYLAAHWFAKRRRQTAPKRTGVSSNHLVFRGELPVLGDLRGVFIRTLEPQQPI